MGVGQELVADTARGGAEAAVRAELVHEPVELWRGPLVALDWKERILMHEFDHDPVQDVIAGKMSDAGDLEFRALIKVRGEERRAGHIACHLGGGMRRPPSFHDVVAQHGVRRQLLHDD